MGRRRPPRRRPSTCSHCGATVPAGRPACPQCGSDASTGWKPPHEIDHASPDLGEFTDEDYESVLRDLPGSRRPDHVNPWGPRRRLWVVVAGILLVLWLIFAWVVP